MRRALIFVFFGLLKIQLVNAQISVEWARTFFFYSVYQFGEANISSIKADRDGNLIFTTHDAINTGSLYQYINISKISKGGLVQWTLNLDTLREYTPVPRERIALDPWGNILVTLYGVNVFTQTQEAKLFKVNPQGNLIREKRIFYHQAGNDRVLEHLSVDSLGDIYLTSIRDTAGIPTFNIRHALKLDSAGNLLWDHVVFPMGHSEKMGNMHIDRMGNTYNTYRARVYIPGVYYQPTYSVISRVNRVGTELWSIVDSNFHFHKSVLANDGDVFVSTFRYFQIPSLMRIDSSGMIRWSKNYPSLSIIDGILADEFGNSYVMGPHSNGLQISKADTAGDVVWSTFYTSTTPGRERLIEGHFFGGDMFLVILQDQQNSGSGTDQIIIVRMDTNGAIIDELVIPTGSLLAGNSTYLEILPSGDAWLTVGYTSLKSILYKLCLFECGFNVFGDTYFDVNGDCIHDSIEIPIRHRPVSIDNGSMYVLTDENGAFKIKRDSGNLVFDLVRPSFVTNSCNSGPYSLSVVPSVLYDSLDFGLSSAPGSDLAVSIFADNARAARYQNIRVQCLNQGPLPDSAWLEIVVDSNTSILPQSVYRDSVAGQHWYFELGEIVPNVPKILNLTVLVDTFVTIGDSCLHLATLRGASVDYIVENNRDSVVQPFRNSYDPNDKAVQPSGVGPDGELDFLNLDALSYTIRFQNTGNDTAYNIAVRDTISPLLDLGTFEMGVTSAPFRLTLDEYRALTWYFDNINLPDSTTDLAGSNGFLKFRIKPLPSLPLGTRIENKAAIYFDYNPPIITNTAVLTNALPLVGLSQPAIQSALEVFPNPTRGRVTLRLRDARQPQLHVQVCDLRGAVLVDTPLRLQDDEASLDISALPPGIYLVQASQGATRHVQRLLVW